MSRTTQTGQQVRAQGPAEVRKGPLEVAAVVVLDPSGEGIHGGLPATWRPLTEDVGVVWCRLPAIRRQRLAGSHLLTEIAGGRQRIHLVGVGTSCLLATGLAMANRDLVRSLILVDPPWPGDDLRELVRFVDEDTLVIQQIETTTKAAPGIGAEPDERLPIGHPEVVAAIVRILVSADAGLPDAPSRPGQNGLERHPVRDRIADALEAFINELGDLGLRG
jgi:pimeloyl-ACP methyl ester carboxylesterase